MDWEFDILYAIQSIRTPFLDKLDVYKRQGLINSDEKAYRGMDRDFEKSSDVIPVTLKKDQTPAAGSKAVSYTHLDVYKRQQEHCTCNQKRGVRRCYRSGLHRRGS